MRSKAAHPGDKNKRLHTSILILYYRPSGYLNIIIDTGKYVLASVHNTLHLSIIIKPRNKQVYLVACDTGSSTIVLYDGFTQLGKIPFHHYKCCVSGFKNVTNY